MVVFLFGVYMKLLTERKLMGEIHPDLDAGLGPNIKGNML
jgi:hypothetical protein